MTKLALLAAAALSLAAADESDTYLRHRSGTPFRESGIDGTVEKNILQLTCTSRWAYGSNFFNVDMLMSAPNDSTANGTTGAPEVYVGAGFDYWNNKFGGAHHDGPLPRPPARHRPHGPAADPLLGPARLDSARP